MSPGSAMRRRDDDRRDPERGQAPVLKEDLWRLEDRLTDSINVGFGGVHKRQDTTNGRVDAAHRELADHGRAIKNLEGEVFERPRRTPPPAAGPEPAGDDRRITQRDVRMVIVGGTAVSAVVVFLLKILPVVQAALRGARP